MMKKTVVINVVGLSRRLLDMGHTPFMSKFAAEGGALEIEPVVPAVTCSAQATYLTGQWPSGHGIVGNGWYFRTECEVKFWRQSNKLVQAPKLWEVLRAKHPGFTCANMFWWYNMYSSVDYSVTPRPNYLANGLKIPDVYSQPAALRDELQGELGTFPLFHFWGPNTNISSSQWIAEASMYNDQKHDPTLTLVYLPHLDYNLQRHGHGHPSIPNDLAEIDGVVEQLAGHYRSKGARVVLLSEYGITEVSRPVHLNRVLREAGLLAVRREQSWELLDAGASRAFVAADHQVAHVYVRDGADIPRVKALLQGVPGVEQVWDRKEQAARHLDHPRSGELVALAESDAWFTYYYWLDEGRAPDFARTVDIHKKPGYDPVEMFVNPAFHWPILAVGWRLLKKKLGFRYLMDVIPLDASLIKGSHGRVPDDSFDYPIFCTDTPDLLPESTDHLQATDIHDLLSAHVERG